MPNGSCHEYTNTFGLPYQYEDEVDFRIIVLTYNRPESVKKCLNAVSKLEMDGDTAAVEIWIDRSEEGVVHQDVVQVAKSFVWGNRKITVGWPICW